jgi:hypothetical protein
MAPGILPKGATPRNAKYRGFSKIDGDRLPRPGEKILKFAKMEVLGGDSRIRRGDSFAGAPKRDARAPSHKGNDDSRSRAV